MVAQAALAGDVLVIEYGASLSSARSAQEFMVRKKDFHCGFATEITFGDPGFPTRLIDIHTLGAFSV